MDKIPNFSYNYYKYLIESLQRTFDFSLLSEAESILQSNVHRRICFLRHDIDVSPKCAHIMAKFEHNLGINTTYCVRTNTNFYSLTNREDVQPLKKIQQLGHEIGFHYDPTRDKDFFTSVGILETIFKIPIRSVSFHKPKIDPNHTIRYNGLINAYAPNLLKWYMTDSKGIWRVGDPVKFTKTPNDNILQVVTHPIWWGEKIIPSELHEDLLHKFTMGW